jgi:Mn-dependent DtxR family transcriptional regulator
MKAALADQDDEDQPSFIRHSTSSILSTTARPMRWVVQDYVGEGLTILGGRQKAGKSWLAMDWAIAVAAGGNAMGSVCCEQGDVLYVDTENGPRRVRARIDTLCPDPDRRPDLSRLEWANEAPALGEGLIAALEEWRSSVIHPRLVIIDAAQKPGWKAAASDSAALPKLQRWATAHGIGVVWLHRTRKVADPFVALGGSGGVFGFADATLLLDRNEFGVTLQVRSRDGAARDSALDFAAGIWSLTCEDDASPPLSRERERILQVMETAAEPMAPKDLAGLLGVPAANIRMMLFRMAKAGQIRKVERGLYRLGSSEEVDPRIAIDAAKFDQMMENLIKRMPSEPEESDPEALRILDEYFAQGKARERTT